MKIQITKSDLFAPNCRTTLALDKGEVLGVGEKGLTKDNLDRLVDLGNAKILGVSDIPVEKKAKEESNDDAVDFTKITDKDELELFALEAHNIELDKRKGIKKMIVDLEEAIANKGE